MHTKTTISVRVYNVLYCICICMYRLYVNCCGSKAEGIRNKVSCFYCIQDQITNFVWLKRNIFKILSTKFMIHQNGKLHKTNACIYSKYYGKMFAAFLLYTYLQNVIIISLAITGNMYNVLQFDMSCWFSRVKSTETCQPNVQVIQVLNV